MTAAAAGPRADAWLIREMFEEGGASLDALRAHMRMPFIDARGLVQPTGGGELKVDGFAFADHPLFPSFAISATDDLVAALATSTGPAQLVVWGRGRLAITATLRRRADGSPFDGCTMRYSGQRISENDASNIVTFVRAVMDRLVATPSHLVEVKPPTTGRDRKSSTHKPWTRADLPRIILLSPEQARLHGHRTPNGGTHASPRIHQRRGHWATLRHDKWGDNKGKQIWRKPAWVGEREWDYRGTHYRVLTEVHHAS